MKAVLAEVSHRPRPQAKATGESEAWQRFEIEQGLQTPAPLEQTPRARAIRDINRIAMRHGWASEIVAALDRAGVSYLAQLHDHEVHDLHHHMCHLVDCAQTACDPRDSLPAR